mmetsp:Transcript_8324/g.13554  ORF Transcript_8324/g.13554 Transcript_8324/m.13554 type:complete len:104 (-) Transcript_8324:1244-1555(-)
MAAKHNSIMQMPETHKGSICRVQIDCDNADTHKGLRMVITIDLSPSFLKFQLGEQLTRFAFAKGAVKESGLVYIKGELELFPCHLKKVSDHISKLDHKNLLIV